LTCLWSLPQDRRMVIAIALFFLPGIERHYLKALNEQSLLFYVLITKHYSLVISPSDIYHQPMRNCQLHLNTQPQHKQSTTFVFSSRLSSRKRNGISCTFHGTNRPILSKDMDHIPLVILFAFRHFNNSSVDGK
jgi:hypothetical protein